jgi:hypothetical protein
MNRQTTNAVATDFNVGQASSLPSGRASASVKEPPVSQARDRLEACPTL